MPNAGIHKRLDAIEYRVEASASTGGSGDGSDNNDYQATGFTLFAPDAVDVASPIYLHVASQQNPTGDTWGVVLDGAWSYSDSGSGFRASQAITLRFLDVTLYATLFSYWRVVVGSVELEVDGAVVQTWGGFDSSSSRTAPDSIPFLFGLMYVTGDVGANRTAYPSPPPTNWGFSASIVCTISGGWRFKEGGTWYSLPASLPPISLPPITGAAAGCGGIVVTGNTWGEHLVLSATKSYSSTDIDGPSWTTTISATKTNGYVGIVPNTPRGIVRMNSDYRAMWYRLARPGVTGRGTRGNRTAPGPGPGHTHTSSADSTVLPARSALLASVGNSTHAIEDNLSDTPYCILFANYQESYGTGPDDGVIPTTAAGATYTYPLAVDSVAHYLGHDDPDMRYWNAVGNPMWLYFHWFPNNEGGDETDPGAQSQWPVDGGSVPNQYWKWTREQWQYQDALPFGEKTKKRNHMIASAVDDSGHTPWMDNFTGENLRFLGISRWLTQEATWPTSKTLDADSAGAWSVDGCTAAFGADIVLSGSGTRTLELDMATWTHAPYLYAHVCDRIGVGWDATNVDSVQVFLVGIDGATVPLCSSPGTYSRPFDRGTEYAGSWGVDNGAGFVSDLGMDASSSGRSLSTMGDPELAMAFSLLPGRTAHKLRFVVTPVDPDEDTTVHYPTLYRPFVKPTQVWESAQCCAWIWADGPGIRWGSFYWFDPDLGFQDPPIPKGLGIRNTIIDWLCWKREVLQGDHALGGTPDLTTELSSLFDFSEGQSVAVVDKFSLAFPLPGADDEAIRAALVNTMAEFPPLAACPWKARDSHWQPTGTHCQKAYDWCQEPRFIVAAGTDPLVLKKPDDTLASSAFSVPSGWKGQTYNVALENDETGWNLYAGSDLFATVRPWHGWFWSGSVSFVALDALCNLHTPDGTFWRATNDSDDALRVRTALNGGPKLGWWTTAKVHDGPGNRNACLCWDPTTNRARLSWDRDDGIYEAISDSDGRTWSVPALSDLIPGGFMPKERASFPEGDRLYVAIVDDDGTGAGKLVGRFRGCGDLDFGTAFDLQIHDDSPVDPGDVLRIGGTPEAPKGYDLDYGFTQDGRWSLSITREGDSAASDWFSVDDGKTYWPAS